MTMRFPAPGRLFRAGAVCSLLFAPLTCQNDSSPNAPPALTGSGLVVSPASLELQPGATGTLQALVSNESGPVTPTPPAQWTTSAAAVATVTGTGTVTAVAVGTATVTATSGTSSGSAVVRVTPEPPSATITEIYPEVTYQEITGWEGSAQIGEVECNAQAYASYNQVVLSRLVNELGVDRVRLHLRSGNENPVDYYATFKASRNIADWGPYRYVAVNDNDDPRVARAGGFQFTEIDHKVDQIITPMRTLLQARGEKLYVNLNYVDFGASGFEHSSDPEEYAELVHVTFTHLRDRYGWVPDAVEIILEPDNTPNWKPDVIGRALVATGDRLKASGFRPAFIAPSNSTMGGAVTYFDQLIKVPRVREYLTDIAYHRYSESDAALNAIASRAVQYGLRTAMLEHIRSDDADLHNDLRNGRNSSWQQFALAFCGQDNGGAYYTIDQSSPSSPNVTLASRSRYFRQYFSYIRQGAVRIGAESGDSRLNPVAFRNKSGRIVIVVRASAAAPVMLRRLPAGTWAATYTTASQTHVALPDANVGSAGTLQVSMPAAGVITIFQR